MIYGTTDIEFIWRVKPTNELRSHIGRIWFSSRHWAHKLMMYLEKSTNSCMGLNELPMSDNFWNMREAKELLGSDGKE
jgi:hypothetical protein